MKQHHPAFFSHMRRLCDNKYCLDFFFNRLSEPNMAYVSGQLEELYMRSSRKDMNDTLTEVLLAACVTPALMPDRLLMEHVLLISILHYSVGLEVNTPPSFLSL